MSVPVLDGISIQYDDAVAALSSPLHQARTSKALKESAARRTKTVEDMREYLKRISLTTIPSNVVHVTGTKGKGSTACMCEAILRERYGQTTGLFTSPHLLDIRERIRVNGKPISQAIFGEAYWQVRRRLEAHKVSEEDELPTPPGYFRMLTLMSLYVFGHYQPRIDVVVLEVGIGGRYDASNILDMEARNVVCGVTLLDLDHTRVLGNSLEQIAWEKGGIFQVRKGSSEYVSKRPTDDYLECGSSVTPAISENELRDSDKRLFAIDTNSSSVLSVLSNCAAIEGRGKKLYLVSEGQCLPANASLGLQGDHQRINAELAIALCEALTKGMLHPPDDRGPCVMLDALEKASWPGRCQSIQIKADDGPTLNLRLDGAHTKRSLEACLKWFASVSHVESEHEHVEKVLIFNCSHERNPVELLQLLSSSWQSSRRVFDAVFFCRADFERPSMVGISTAAELLHKCGVTLSTNFDNKSEGEAQTWQQTLADIWRHLEASTMLEGSNTKVTVNLNVRDALDQVREFQCFKRIEILVTGSLYIVGSALKAVEWREDVASGDLTNMTSTAR
jgi:folylpolyglutamate synthase